MTQSNTLDITTVTPPLVIENTTSHSNTLGITTVTPPLTRTDHYGPE